MNTIYEDPRLTAYVLGEMSPRDRAKFEKEIAASSELARAVEEMKESASLFGEALPLEAADLGLSYAQRENVQRAMRGEKKAPRRWAWMPQPFSTGWNWAGAALVVALGAWLWVFTGAMNTGVEILDESGLTASMDEKKKDLEQASSGIRLEEERQIEVTGRVDGPSKENAFFDVAVMPAEPESTPAPTEEIVVGTEGGSGSGLLGSTDMMVAGTSSSVVPAVPQTAPPAVVTAPSASVANGARRDKVEGVSRSYSLAAGNTPLSEQPRRSASNAGPALEGKISSGYLDSRERYDYDAAFRNNRASVGGEAYEAIRDNPFKRVLDVESGTSTFGADVDTASYSNVRRFLQDGQLPPKESVRIEELLNYFTYNYPQGEGRAPFATSVEIASAPWAPQHRLVRVGIRAKDVAARERQPMNLVFLVDVSGSMNSENKLPLVQKSLRLLTRNLERRDRVAIVVYAGSSGLVLDSTSDKRRILDAIDRMKSGGSTNGAGGIRQAYQVARDHFIENGINRVILCTDGDFNVGTTDRGELVSMIEQKREEGVFLNIYGFGMGNLKDATLEQLANKGNGTYGYIDGFAEAQKVFSEQLSGTLVTVAKDVKFQIEFNPSQVSAWRQIGYENRQLAREDFNDDRKDAGEVGAGHTVTVLYEVVPVGVEPPVAPDAHRYLGENPNPPMADQSARGATNPKGGNKEMLFLKIRYKEPKEDESKLLTFPVKDGGQVWERTSGDFKFAASVASFGMLLRESPYAGRANWTRTLELARAGKGEDEHGHRAEYIRLVELARDLSRRE